MQERRQIKRLGTSLYVKFSNGAEQSLKSEGFTKDISIGGARLFSLKKPRLHENLELSMDVPNNPDLTIAEANVRWVGEDNQIDEIGRKVFPVGIEFTFMENQDKVYLKEYLALQKPI